MQNGENMDKILVTRSSMPKFEEYVEEIRELWETHWLTNMGVKHQQLETNLADYLGMNKDNIALFVNGHQALECIIEAFGLGKEKNDKGEAKDEVITTPYTFASTTNAIVRKGLKPVFCDIKLENYTIDESKIEALITDRTCAILPVHVYGNLCDTEKIQNIADKYNLKVIYDAAHAFGVTKKEVSSAKFGDASMFSFHATKVYNTIEGGAICFKDAKFKKILNNWKNFGITGSESVEYIGGNAKMNEFSAAMGICNLRHLSEEIEKRKKVSDAYKKYLSGIDGIILNQEQKDVNSNYAYFPIVVDEEKYGKTRDDIYNKLAKNNIYARKYFYPLTSEYECYRDSFDAKDTPIALWISNRVLTLPMYADLKEEQIKRICSIIRELR